MNKFYSGQKLTAEDLNGIVSIAEGQNIPTDTEFNKSMIGVNTWSSNNATNVRQSHFTGLTIEARPYNIGTETNPDIRYFWYVYLGGTQFDTEGNAKFPTFNVALDSLFTNGQSVPVFRVMSVQLDSSYKLQKGIVFFNPSSAGTSGYNANLNVSKINSGTSQVIQSDGYGWFNTGIAVSPIESMPNVGNRNIYATLIRTNDLGVHIQSQDVIFSNLYSVILVISNDPITHLNQLNYDSGEYIIDPFDTDKKITPVEIIGGHSTLLAYTYDINGVNNVMYTGNSIEHNIIQDQDVGQIYQDIIISSDTVVPVHKIDMKYVYVDDERYPITLSAPTSPELSSEIILEQFPSFIDTTYGNKYLGGYIDIDLSSLSLSSVPLSAVTYNVIDVMPSLTGTIYDLRGAEFQAEQWFLLQLQNQSLVSQHKYIPHFISIESTATNGQNAIRRIIYTKYLTKGIQSIKTKSKTTPQPFDIEGSKVVQCVIQCGNKVVECEDYTIDTSKSWIYLHIDRTESSSESTYEITVDQTYDDDTDTSMTIVLYEYENGKIILDRRPKSIIPVFAL